MPIHITSVKENIEALIKDFASKKIKFQGEAYFSIETGISGILIFPKDDPTVTIDIFIKDEVKGLRIGLKENEEKDG